MVLGSSCGPIRQFNSQSQCHGIWQLLPPITPSFPSIRSVLLDIFQFSCNHSSAGNMACIFSISPLPLFSSRHKPRVIRLNTTGKSTQNGTAAQASRFCQKQCIIFDIQYRDILIFPLITCIILHYFHVQNCLHFIEPIPFRECCLETPPLRLYEVRETRK